MIPLSPFKKHFNDWIDCKRCSACERRTKVVIARGQVPCDVMLVGEAPGKSEDILGEPFVGPAGKLLDRIVKRALGELRMCKSCRRLLQWDQKWVCGRCKNWQVDSIRTLFTNLVGCIPLDNDGTKTAEPEAESIEACRSRVEELIAIAKPKLLVAVGKLARDWLEPGMLGNIKWDKSKIAFESMTHPAAILRANAAAQGLMEQKCVVVLRNAAEEKL